MPRSAVKLSRGQATRADILNVARRLFSEHGYHRTGLSDIQAATGLTKGAFYHHFRSKEDVALAVLDAAEADYASQLIEPVMKKGTPAERIRAMFDRILALNGTPEWCNCRMLVLLAAELTPAEPRLQARVRELENRLRELWQGLIEEARLAGQTREPVVPEVHARWITSTLLGMLVIRKLGSLDVSPRDVVSQLLAAILKTG